MLYSNLFYILAFGSFLYSSQTNDLLEEIRSRLEEVVVGQVFTACAGQNPARQAAVAAGLPFSVPAYGVNMLCASGLKAVCLAAGRLKLAAIEALESEKGKNKIAPGGWAIAGGQESMSQAPHATMPGCGLRRGGFNNANRLPTMGNYCFADTLLNDGLRDAFYECLMGDTAENLAFE
ncbi:unnamed protein product [Protopolystoma xenopodis]|uniref:Thiolase N-terminal domain-containing protein n=1 Tax=Protopolystoma xenopodis TaxID=117903 RepID=A0A448XQD9_9PLAT|nr:unnamed protein product [Protopolystoma xenopodis]